MNYKKYYDLNDFRKVKMGLNLPAGYKERLANFFEGRIRSCILLVSGVILTLFQKNDIVWLVSIRIAGCIWSGPEHYTEHIGKEIAVMELFTPCILLPYYDFQLNTYRHQSGYPFLDLWYQVAINALLFIRWSVFAALPRFEESINWCV